MIDTDPQPKFAVVITVPLGASLGDADQAQGIARTLFTRLDLGSDASYRVVDLDENGNPLDSLDISHRIAGSGVSAHLP